MPAKGSSGAAIPDKTLFQMSKHALERMAESRFRTELKALSLEEMTLLLQKRELTPSQQKILKFFLIDTRNQTAANIQDRATKRSKNNPRKKRASAKNNAPSTGSSFWSGFTNWFSNITPGALIQRRTTNPTPNTTVKSQRRADDAPSKGLRHRVPVDYQIYICELVFGTNYLLPGGAARVQALTEPLLLTEGINGLDLSAGIGGTMDALREKSGLYLTMMEGNPDVAAAAMARMAERPEADQRDIIAYRPATLDLGAVKYDWAVSREMLFHISDKLGFLNKLQKSMYNGGQVVLTDLALPDDANPNDPNLALWRDAEAHPIHPITVSQYRTLLEDANMEVLDFENDTEACANDIRHAWSKFTESMQAQSIDPAFQQHILHEAEYWHSRLRAFDGGALRLLRIRAVHRAPAQA